MSEQNDGYNDPKIAINCVYTRNGDAGQTRLVGGQSVDKDDVRIEAYGAVDELNAVLGMARATILKDVKDGASAELGELAKLLLRVQHELFNTGSILATRPEDVGPSQPRVSVEDVSALEADIDRMNGELEPLRSFVLPGGSRLEAELHLARTVCRRAERRVVSLARETEGLGGSVRYLNRLSDALFVWSRWSNVKGGGKEVLWDPNAASSGS